MGAACIDSHSTNVVITPNTNMKSIYINKQKNIVLRDPDTAVPSDIAPVTPKTTIIALNAMVMMVSNMAGETVINMS